VKIQDHFVPADFMVLSHLVLRTKLDIQYIWNQEIKSHI
jgi:hypothetical protein